LSWISGGIIGNVKTLGALFEFDYTPRNFLTATVSLFFLGIFDDYRGSLTGMAYSST
jgi:hypothetical protein